MKPYKLPKFAKVDATGNKFLLQQLNKRLTSKKLRCDCGKIMRLDPTEREWRGCPDNDHCSSMCCAQYIIKTGESPAPPALYTVCYQCEERKDVLQFLHNRACNLCYSCVKQMSSGALQYIPPL
jgi:hypothetical protein